MLIFDAMCFVALLHMHCDAGTTETDPELVADVCEAHLGFHHSLPFTTETGKRVRGADVPWAGRGAAAATTRIFRGDGVAAAPRRRCG